MLRLLSIRNFVVVDALDLELDGGFSVLTGETGAGKSILLDALALLLGDRFETRQLKPGADRAELAASFDVGERPDVIEWLDGEGLATDDGTLLLRRTLDAQGRSRAWINGRPATLAQLASIGERLVDLHGQHAHQSLVSGEAQRTLVDAFGGFSTLARETAAAWRAWREAAERRDAAAQAAQATPAEREFLAARAHELSALAVTADEWTSLSNTHSRLAHAASLIEAAASGEDELVEADAAIVRRLAALATRLAALATHDAALSDIVALIEPARIQLEEAARELRNYRQKLDVDPAELSRVALAVQVVTSEVGEVPTLIFDEVDVGIGGAVAATVGRLLQSLGERRQVLCVTHLPQVAAFADRHFRVTKRGDAHSVHADVAPLAGAERVDELARMLAGSAITAKTRAHAKELLEQHRRGA